MSTTVFAKMQQRYDTAANWTAENPILLEGEIGIESDTDKFKFGDGVTAWNSLDYASSEATAINSIDDISDVDVSTITPVDGRALIYQNGKWVPGPVVGGVDYVPDGGEPFYNNVVALFGFSGANGATAVVDESSLGANITVGNGGSISTAENKFGGTSLRITNPGPSTWALLTVANSTHALGTRNWTMECWFKPDSAATGFQYLFAHGGNTNGISTSGNTLVIRYDYNNGGTGFAFQFFNGTSAVYRNPSDFPRQLTTDWQHIAFVRDGATIRGFVDGVQIGTYNIGSASISTPSSIRFACGNGVNGYVDEWRITLDQARYTANFTPPAAAFFRSSSNPVAIPYSIDRLDDVDTSTSAPANGQVLTWDQAGTKWKPAAIPAASISNLDAIGDVHLPGPVVGGSIVWSGTRWVSGPKIGGVTPEGANIDPFYANVITQLNFDSNVGGRTLVDTSPNPKTFSTSQSTSVLVISSSQSKSGGSSLFSNVTTPIPYIANSGSSFAVASAVGRTIEFWMYSVSSATSTTHTLLELSVDGAFGSGIAIRRSANSGGYTLLFEAFGSTRITHQTTLTHNAWHHVALTRTSSGVWKLFLNGVGSTTSYTNANAFGNRLELFGGAGNGIFYDGYRDTSVDRYSAGTLPFTPFSGPYTQNLPIPYSIDFLDDVDTTTAAPTNGQVLNWNGTNWVPSTSVLSKVTGITGATAITNCVAISQANYDAIATPDPSTLYVIV